MPSRARAHILEQGDIFFFYRPRVGAEEVRSRGDVQRFYMVLAPEQPRKVYRLFVVGSKRLPKRMPPRRRPQRVKEGRLGEQDEGSIRDAPRCDGRLRLGDLLEHPAEVDGARVKDVGVAPGDGRVERDIE